MSRRLLLSLTLVLCTGCTVPLQPMTPQQLSSFGADYFARTTVGQEPITRPVGLYDAMARALKYNLDSKVEVMHAALKLRELDLAHHSLLPRLVANAGYAARDQADPSIVSTRDKDVVTADLSFSWNVLDFGLSYVRAQQAADEALIQEEMKRRIVNRVVEDVRTAYWRAVSYERLVGRMRDLEVRVATSLREADTLATDGRSSPLVALSYQRDLIQVRQDVESLEGGLRVAKNQLAALMNVAPGTDFTIEVPARGTLPNFPETQAPLPDLFRAAASNRPEMREVFYRLRINEKEKDAAFLELLPSLNLYTGINYDSNQFITAHDWVSWGVRLSWNAMRLFSRPSNERRLEAQKMMLDARGLSVAMAIMTQVQVSRVRLEHLRRTHATARDMQDVTARIMAQLDASTTARRTGQHILIRETMNALLAEARLDSAYADLENAYANLQASLGLDPFPEKLSTDIGVDVIAASLRDLWAGRGLGTAGGR